MPTPTNTTPATATAITSLPFTQTIAAADFTLAPAGALTPSCSSPLHSLWYTYTPVMNGPTVLGVTASDPDLACAVSAWLGPAVTPTQLDNVCQFVAYDPDGVQFNLTVGVPVYLLIDSEAVTVTSDVDLTIAGGVTTTSPAGSLLVTNDTPGFPATILSASDLSILWSLALPASEMADSVPTGEIGLLAEGTDPDLAVSMNVYDADQNLIAAHTAMIIAGQSSVSPVRGNGADLFYVLCQTDSTADAPILKTIDLTGVAGPTWTLPMLMHNTSEAMAPDRADAIVYYAERSSTNTILHAYDLMGSAPLADLCTVLDFAVDRDILILGTTDLLVAGHSTITQHTTVLRIDTSGVTQATYDLGVNHGSGGRIALGLDDPTSFWVMNFPVLGTSRFQHIKVSDGSVLFTADRYNWEPGNDNHGETFGPSQSCPLVLLAQEATPPALTLAIEKTHTGTFTRGGSGAFTVTVSNPIGGAATSGVITVTETIPTGFVLGAMSGTGWDCTDNVCTRDDVLDPGDSYPPILVTVLVDANAADSVCNDVAVAAETGDPVDATDCVDIVDMAMITYPARRLRRFALPFDQNKWIFIHRLEFIMQTGVGLISGQGSDPVVMMRLSRDGGETWGPEREMSIGKMGAYKWRVFTNRLGRARNPVVELTVSDPVMLAFLSCTADLESGTS